MLKATVSDQDNPSWAAGRTIVRFKDFARVGANVYAKGSIILMDADALALTVASVPPGIAVGALSGRPISREVDGNGEETIR